MTEMSLDDPRIATLAGLVAHHSPTGQEAGAVAWLVERMRALGFTRAFVDPAGNAIGEMGDGPRQLLLVGHIDTVPGEIPVRLEGDLLHGRGAVDAKGPLAAFVDAAAALGPLAGWKIVVVGAVDEEGDSRGARAIGPHYHPEYAIFGEPGGWQRLGLGYKGCARAAVQVQRADSHSASGQATACEAAVAAWQAVQEWAFHFNQGRERAFEQVSPSLQGLGSVDDGFSQTARLELVTRLPLDLDPAAWYAQLGQLLPQAQVEPCGFAIPAYRCEKNTPLAGAFLGAIRSAGGQPGLVLKTGTSDMNILAPQWGCPALVYGPGNSQLDHTPYEHLSISEYRQAVIVLAAVLERLVGKPASSAA